MSQFSSKVTSRLFVLGAVGTLVIAAACADIVTDPLVPVTIEAEPQAFPSIAIGDVLRDTLGNEQPIRVTVRNIQGDVIEDAPIRYLYVQAQRDSALEVDSTTGRVLVRKQPAAGQLQIAARYAFALQVLIPVIVTNEPDTAFATDTDLRLVGFVPDTGRRGVDSNSVSVGTRVQYKNATQALQPVNDWLVRYAIVRPANQTNDTTASVFLVNENGRPSQIDTTDGSGSASRRVRVRPLLFPAAGRTVDTVEVEAMIWRRGQPVKGAPIRILIPVSSPSTRG
jgi:hypothetical protein